MKILHVLLLASLLTSASTAVAQTTTTVGINGTAGYTWSDLAPTSGTQVESTGAYLFPALTSPYSYTFNITVDEPGAVSGTLAVTLYASNQAATADYRLTQYTQNSLTLLAIDQPNTTGNEARTISNIEQLFVSVDTSNLTSLNGGLISVTLSSFTTYGLADTESLSVLLNGTSTDIVTGTTTSGGYDSTGAVSHALDLSLESGDIVSWSAVNTLQYRMGSLTFAIESTVSAVPEPSTYAAIAGLATLATAAWRRRKSRSA